MVGRPINHTHFASEIDQFSEGFGRAPPGQGKIGYLKLFRFNHIQIIFGGATVYKLRNSNVWAKHRYAGKMLHLVERKVHG